MDEDEWLVRHFEQHRPHLRAVAYRMLGSLAEADDAVQDTWLRLSRSGTEGVENLGGWLTTIVARVCLNMLRSRDRRREEPLAVHVPDPVISKDGNFQPEDEALLADSVGLALLVVLDTLTPDERLAFVLHDLFDLPFAQIAAMIGRSTAAAKQLASRARRRVRGAALPADPDLARQRAVGRSGCHHGRAALHRDRLHRRRRQDRRDRRDRRSRTRPRARGGRPHRVTGRPPRWARAQVVRRGPVRTSWPMKVNMTAFSSSGAGGPAKRCWPTRCGNFGSAETSLTHTRSKPRSSNQSHT